MSEIKLRLGKNPSKLASYVNAYNLGLLTLEELMRLKRETLVNTNVYQERIQ